MRWGNKSNNSGRRRVVFPRRVKNGLLRAQKGRCAYCGHTHRSRYLVIDHKHPVSRGGGDENDNLQLLCNSCNMRKGIQSDEEFRYRYQRLLPVDGSIPSPPIPQDSFSEETQRTKAPRDVRAIYHERFTAARERQGASRAGQGSGWDAEDFDDLASFEDSEGHETTEEALAPIPPSVLYPKAVDLGAATAADMGAVFAWLGVGFIGSFIACYVIGVKGGVILGHGAEQKCTTRA